MNKTVFFRTILGSGRVLKWKFARKLGLELPPEIMEAEMKETLKKADFDTAKEIARQGLGREITEKEIIEAANANKSFPRCAAKILQLLPCGLRQKEWERWINAYIEERIRTGYPDLNCVDLLPWSERKSAYEKMLKGVIENRSTECLKVAQEMAVILERNLTEEELLGIAIRCQENKDWFDLKETALLLPEPKKSEWLEKAMQGLISSILQNRYDPGYVDFLLGVKGYEKFYRDLTEGEKKQLCYLAIRKKYWGQTIALILQISGTEERVTAARKLIPLYLEDDNQWPRYEIRRRLQGLLAILPFLLPEERIEMVRNFIFTTLICDASGRIESHQKLLDTIEEPERTELLQEIFLRCLSQKWPPRDLREYINLLREPDKQELLHLLAY